ncbi:GDSL-type esterase/lipase family protein [Parabacteroides sp. OttesenSCG-928-G21]|nr:GDSL-type esterase/lipase family protein [Parabacteroides sp. OttesenSCG-928-G21]
MRRLLFLIFPLFIVARTYAQVEERLWLNVIYIGNSITQGVQIDNPRRNAPPVKASVYLRAQPNVGEIKYSNQGVSGKTTVDFLPQTNTFFPKVIEVAEQFKEDTWAKLVFSIMLGTNDSAIKGPNGSPVSAEQYYQNMRIIIDELLSRYPAALVVLHKPLWYSPNTHNASLYLEEGLKRLESYFPQLEKLVAHYQDTYPNQVFMGDTEAFDYFKENHLTELIPENGNSGVFYLHPNLSGASKLGEFWGKAIYRAITHK